MIINSIIELLCMKSTVFVLTSEQLDQDPLFNESRHVISLRCKGVSGSAIFNKPAKNGLINKVVIEL